MSYLIITYNIISPHIIVSSHPFPPHDLISTHDPTPSHPISYNIIQYDISYRIISSHHPIPYCSTYHIAHHPIPYHIESYHLISAHTILYHTISSRIIRYYIILYHIILYHTGIISFRIFRVVGNDVSAVQKRVGPPSRNLEPLRLDANSNTVPASRYFSSND